MVEPPEQRAPLGGEGDHGGAPIVLRLGLRHGAVGRHACHALGHGRVVELKRLNDGGERDGIGPVEHEENPVLVDRRAALAAQRADGSAPPPIEHHFRFDGAPSFR